FRGLDRDPVVIADDIGEGLQSERAGVVLESAPGSELDAIDGLGDLEVAAEGLARPLFADALRAEVGIPGKAAEAVKIGLRHVIAVPVVVEAHIGYADEAAHGALEDFAGHQRLDG